MRSPEEKGAAVTAVSPGEGPQKPTKPPRAQRARMGHGEVPMGKATTQKPGNGGSYCAGRPAKRGVEATPPKLFYLRPECLILMNTLYHLRAPVARVLINLLQNAAACQSCVLKGLALTRWPFGRRACLMRTSAMGTGPATAMPSTPRGPQQPQGCTEHDYQGHPLIKTHSRVPICQMARHTM